ncbi:MAG TPA: ribonuclease PH [Chloroflexota bacterium]|nr:ribonuclease PH [Chloroflexota bacterium]
MTRDDGRALAEVRPVRFTLDFMPYAEGSVLIELGNSRVICAVSVEETAPPFLKGTGVGWLTAEYRMLPRATHQRTQRDSGGKVDGRSTEIQRLIGRSLRAALDRAKLGERTLFVDCDVINADGGTRTAAITGSFVALVLACQRLLRNGTLTESPLRRQVAAISAGLVRGEPMLDLSYAEDSIADADCNVVLTQRGETVEFQLSAEHGLPTAEQVSQIAHLAQTGIRQMLEMQRTVLQERAGEIVKTLLSHE